MGVSYLDYNDFNFLFCLSQGRYYYIHRSRRQREQERDGFVWAGSSTPDDVADSVIKLQERYEKVRVLPRSRDIRRLDLYIKDSRVSVDVVAKHVMSREYAPAPFD